MYASSLLQGIRHVDEQGDRLLSLRTLSGVEPSERLDAAIGTLLDLAELFRSSAPFPPRVERETEPTVGADSPGVPTNRNRSGETEDDDTRRTAPTDLVRRVLELEYEHGAVTVEQLPAPFEDLVPELDRFETVQSYVFVPLASVGPHARNWPPTIAAILETADDVLADFRRLSRRVRADVRRSATGHRAPAGRSRALVSGCETVVDMLETLLGVVRRADADARYVRTRTDHDQRDLLTTVVDATSQLRGDDSA